MNTILDEIEETCRTIIGVHPEDFMAMCLDLVLTTRYALEQVVAMCEDHGAVAEDVDLDELQDELFLIRGLTNPA